MSQRRRMTDHYRFTDFLTKPLLSVSRDTREGCWVLVFVLATLFVGVVTR